MVFASACLGIDGECLPSCTYAAEPGTGEVSQGAYIIHASRRLDCSSLRLVAGPATRMSLEVTPTTWREDDSPRAPPEPGARRPLPARRRNIVSIVSIVWLRRGPKARSIERGETTRSGRRSVARWRPSLRAPLPPSRSSRRRIRSRLERLRRPPDQGRRAWRAPARSGDRYGG